MLGGEEMNFQINYKNLDASPRIEAFFERKVKKIRKLTAHFSDELVQIQACLEKSPKREEYHITLTLYLPNHTLHSKDKGENIIGSINSAFEDLQRQIEKLKSQLRKEHLWRKDKSAGEKETEI